MSECDGVVSSAGWAERLGSAALLAWWMLTIAGILL